MKLESINDSIRDEIDKQKDMLEKKQKRLSAAERMGGAEGEEKKESRYGNVRICIFLLVP